MNTMTETEAREKWCPMARVAANRLNGAYNRTSTDNTPHHPCVACIASACMAWRWKPTPSGATPPDRGYCGAFGRPDE